MKELSGETFLSISSRPSVEIMIHKLEGSSRVLISKDTEINISYIKYMNNKFVLFNRFVRIDSIIWNNSPHGLKCEAIVIDYSTTNSQFLERVNIENIRDLYY